MPSIRNRVSLPTPTVTPPSVDHSIDVAPRRGVARADADDAARAAAAKLVATVTELKDLSGAAALAGFGAGDPRVTNRRRAVSALLADTSGHAPVAHLADISREVAQDIAFLQTAERKEYTTAQRDPFGWFRPYDNHTISADKLNTELSTRLTAQARVAAEFAAGTRPYMDVSTLSVIGLASIKDPTTKANGLMDALLQFRARTDAANQREDAGTTRIDRFGLPILAEQRILLAQQELVPGDLKSERVWALLREVISSHPISSTNGIFEARNAVGSILLDQGRFAQRETSYQSPTRWIWKELPPGATASPYSSIHHNFSRDTPKNIALWIEEWMFPVGARVLRADCFVALVSAMVAARNGDGESADRYATGALTALTLSAPTYADLILRALEDAFDGEGDDVRDLQTAADVLRTVLQGLCQKDLGENVEKNLEMAAATYTAVVHAQPTVDTVQAQLFRAGPAWKEVADVVVALHAQDDALALQELGEARLALKDAVFATASGYERKELINLDANLARMTNELLGDVVEQLGTMTQPSQHSLGLLALQAGLRSALASGLHAIVDDADPAAADPLLLGRVLADIDAALAIGRVSEHGYRALMGQAHVAVTKVIQNIRAFADARAAHVAVGGVTLDPEFIDQFIKGTSLHYATAIAQKGMAVGLTEKITARRVENVEGMRVLNGIGPVVFSSVVFAENGKQLADMGTTKDQLAVLYNLEEKKMVAVGGLFVDTQHAPGGNSHLNMYAMNNGIPVVALPGLRERYAEFFDTAAREGGVYINDTDGFTMMTVAQAYAEGLIGAGADALDALRPGVNRSITYLKPSADGTAFDVVHKHDAIINDKRATRMVELYIPQQHVRGVGAGVPTFAELAKLGVHGRHLAGEKGTVLALMSQHPVLGGHVPDGSVITPADIRGLLAGAAIPGARNLLDAWDDVYRADPKVGVVDDRNFRDSAFYTDARYRRRTREDLVELTRRALSKSLLDRSSSPPTLTSKGQALYDNIMRNVALREAQTGSVIFRSSFTGEDRPGKSGAGQYESYVDRKCANAIYGKDIVDAQFEALANARATSDADVFAAALAAHNAFLGPARIDAVIGVIESCWMPEPVENNVSEQFFLKHIGPTVVVQACLTPDVSGVMVSRDVDSGARNTVTFQLVHGFGGGVDGGKATEGIIGQQPVVRFVDGEPHAGGPVMVQGIEITNDDMLKLRDIVLETERFFQDTVEPGKGYAVDMEVARSGGAWQVVQARVILVDK